MRFYARIGILFSFLTVCTLYLVWRSDTAKSDPIWSKSSKAAAGDVSDKQEAIYIPAPPLPAREWTEFQPPRNQSSLFDGTPAFLPGVPKPAGSTYTKSIVMGRMAFENTSWLDTVNLPPTVRRYIYDVDPKSYVSPDSLPEDGLLRIPQPGGHEAMAYLTYIIDNYGALPDVSMFMHAHRHAWHNNEMLNNDAVEHIKRLSVERVIREGYMSLRCHWSPGCPDYIHPLSKEDDKDKLEEGAMAKAWEAMFPNEPVPEVIAAPCCAQFAVSRERIESVSLNRYMHYRNWLMQTDLRDYTSGRVFEYLWHKIFTGQSTICPDMRVCHCDGYGVCFADDKEFDYWFELIYKRRQVEKKLQARKDMVEAYNPWKWRGKSKSGAKPPASEADVMLQREIDGYTMMLEERRLQALEAGKDPRIRARVAGRKWSDGDGY